MLGLWLSHTQNLEECTGAQTAILVYGTGARQCKACVSPSGRWGWTSLRLAKFVLMQEKADRRTCLTFQSTCLNVHPKNFAFAGVELSQFLGEWLIYASGCSFESRAKFALVAVDAVG